MQSFFPGTAILQLVERLQRLATGAGQHGQVKSIFGAEMVKQVALAHAGALCNCIHGDTFEGLCREQCFRSGENTGFGTVGLMWHGASERHREVVSTDRSVLYEQTRP